MLTHYSGFFRGALNGNFHEAKTKTVTLADDNPTTFELFVHWLYYQDFPNKNRNDDPELVKSFYSKGFPDDRKVVKLYVFGDEYEVEHLRRDAIDLLFRSMEDPNSLLPYPESTEYAFAHLSADDPMCRLLVDLFCRYEILDDDAGHEEFVNIAFLQTMWHRYVYFCRTKDVDIDDKLSLCNYHEHATDEEKTTCEEARGEGGNVQDDLEW